MLLMLGAFLFIGHTSSETASAEETSAISSTISQAPSAPVDPSDGSSTPATVSDDEIEGFLFHIRDAGLLEEIKALDADPITYLRIPVLFNVTPAQLSDTWNEARSGGRRHKATDIIAPRGSFIVSPTKAIVTNVGHNNQGGNYVLTANPGGEQFYYAHLDGYAKDLAPGRVLKPGDLIGYVGDTGNARRTVPHLHFAIYYKKAPVNPYPRLEKQFSLEDGIEALRKIIDGSDVPFSTALHIIEEYRDKLVEAQSKGIALPDMIVWILEHNDVLSQARALEKDLTLKSTGGGVRLLQELLIVRNAGPAAQALSQAGTSDYFGTRTQKALAEYQKTLGISPASGNFGPATRAQILNLLVKNGTPLRTAKSDEFPRVAGASFHDAGTSSISQAALIDHDLTIGSEGKEVLWLQQLLIEADTGPAAKAAARAGATGHFGPLTKRALAEYQLALGITAAQGYFGPKTRALLKSAAGASTPPE